MMKNANLTISTKKTSQNTFLTSLESIRADACVFVVIAISCVLMTDEVEPVKKILGFVAFAIPLYYCIILRKWRKVAIVMMLITLINFNLFFSVCLDPELFLGSQWQKAIYDTPESYYTLKSIVLFTAFFYFGLTSALAKNRAEDALDISSKAESNSVFIVVGFIIIIYALVFGIDRGDIGAYASNSNPLYEYAIVFFVMLWGSTKPGGIPRKLLVVYASLYIVQGLLFGDRSSAFPMAIALYVLVVKHQLPVLPLLGLGIIGILLSNCVDIFRASGSIDLLEVLERGLYSNTVSYSFYGGTSITIFSEIVDNNIQYFINFIISIFFGDMGEKTNLTLAAREYSAALFNRDGGFTSSYLYFWFGYPGVAIGAWAMGTILGKLSSSESHIASMFCLFLACFAIRWYVYIPIAFFRTSLFVPLVVYVAFKVFADKKSKQINSC